jgi:hypothetical protein
LCKKKLIAEHLYKSATSLCRQAGANEEEKRFDAGSKKIKYNLCK